MSYRMIFEVVVLGILILLFFKVSFSLLKAILGGVIFLLVVYFLNQAFFHLNHDIKQIVFLISFIVGFFYALKS